MQQAYVAANDPHAWCCDLCNHGDIHPNPGPPSAIPIWSCNVGRGAGAWEFAKLGISQQIPILAIQEVGLKEHELQALCKFVDRKGYRAYEAPAVLRSRNAWGGVLLMVHKQHCSRLVSSRSNEGLQAVTVVAESCAVTCFYQTPNGLRLRVC